MMVSDNLQAICKLPVRVAICASLVFLSACSHMQGSNGTGSGSGFGILGGSGKKSEAEAAQAAGKGSQEGPETVADLNDTGADLEALPLAVNRQVLLWIDYFQGQGRPHMERYLSRSTRYMPVMKKILKDAGVPEDLIYIALIESGFNGTAKSTANAVGYWQFIRGTGKRYGLKIDTYVDERRDFVRSTQAAAQYFKGLYDIFHSWYLAIASYNVGENRVKNVVQKYRTRDFWQLARENKLPEETSNYVPKFIAARLIAKSPEKYGFTDIDYQAPVEYAEVELTGSVDIAKLATAMGIEYDDLRDLNPSFKRGVAFARKAGEKWKLRVPKGTEEKALAEVNAAQPENKKVYVADQDYSYYRIRRGDTISMIAKKFGTNQQTIRRLNNLSVRTSLVAGRRIRVPADDVAGIPNREDTKGRKQFRPGGDNNQKLGLGAAAKYMVNDSNGRGPRALASHRPNLAVHIVKRGDSLVEIARKYHVSVNELLKTNKISRRSKVAVGTRLEIPQ
jgi:membrane-bound lytic murein transglycosylase D